ncbi:MAG: SDR family NAD(P)-dependent oxidoreductase, partial [Actinomycetota bacterium]|nr:SDR family NAD(P)-dependent oxidoreductase [Actinomycetota bacterium]
MTAVPDDSERAVAVVTGAATGIGRGVALRLADDGAAVGVLDTSAADDTIEQIEREGGSAFAVRCDVTDEASVGHAAAAVESTLGRASILVNAAGIYPNHPFSDLTFAE